MHDVLVNLEGLRSGYEMDSLELRRLRSLKSERFDVEPHLRLAHTETSDQ
jgi:hypothetical protein